MIILRTGYDFQQAFDILVNGLPDTITGWTFKASLIDATGTEIITDTACAVLSVPLARVQVNFTASQTAALVPGRANIEIAINTGSLRLPLPFYPVEIQTGYTLT